MRYIRRLIAVICFGAALVFFGLTETGDFFRPSGWPWVYLPGFGYSVFDMGSGLLLGYCLIELLYLSDRRKVADIGQKLSRSEVATIAGDIKLVCWNTTNPIIVTYPQGTTQTRIDELTDDAETERMELLSNDKKQLTSMIDPNFLAGKIPDLFSIRAEKLRRLQLIFATYFDSDFLVLLINLTEYLDRLNLHVELVAKERASTSKVNLAKMYEDEVYNDLQKLLSFLVSAHRKDLY